MNEHNRQMLDTYYKEAASWNIDRVKTMRGSSRIAWFIAGCAMLVAVLEAGALMLLTPLKTVEPYTLLVDKTTGYVQPLRPLEPGRTAPDSALTQSFLVQYILAREGFDIAEVRANYRKVALFSGDSARTGYLAAMQPSNPQSPLNRYPHGTVIDTRVKSVSPIGPNAVLVRFDTIRTESDGRPGPAMPWVSLVRYRYSNEQLSLEDRFVNPLGFQVISYRRNPEALPQPLDYADMSPSAASDTTAGAAPAPKSVEERSPLSAAVPAHGRVP